MKTPTRRSPGLWLPLMLAAVGISTLWGASGHAGMTLRPAPYNGGSPKRSAVNGGKPVYYGYHVALRGAHERYFAAEADGGLAADRQSIQAWETFELLTDKGETWEGHEMRYGDVISLLAPSHNRFVQGKPNGSAAAAGAAAQAWERFTILKSDGGTGGVVACGDTIALRSSSNKYLVAEPEPEYLAKADRDAIGPWEKIKLECVKPQDYVRADLVRDYHPCPSGQFEDKGKCWSCPGGSTRTASAVDGPTACSKTQAEYFRSAHGPKGVNPGGDWFWDLSTFAWWSCHGGERTVFGIDGDRACRWPAVVRHNAATDHGASGCQGMEWWDPIDGGGCWACPVGYCQQNTNVKLSWTCRAGKSAPNDWTSSPAWCE